NGDIEVIITCSQADAADDVDDGGRGPGRQVVGQGIAADDVEAAADLVEFQPRVGDVAEIKRHSAWQHVKIEQAQQAAGAGFDGLEATILDGQRQVAIQ